MLRLTYNSISTTAEDVYLVVYLDLDKGYLLSSECNFNALLTRREVSKPSRALSELRIYKGPKNDQQFFLPIFVNRAIDRTCRQV